MHSPSTSNIMENGQQAGPSGFRPPMDPNIPQDVSLIMEMVQSHQVVGSMPPLDMTVREKRRLVEESMRLAKERKEKAKADGLDTPATPAAVSLPVVGDSSSEEESSSEDESEEEDDEKKKPMTEEEHRLAKAEADDMVYGPEAELDSDFEEAESEDDEEVFKLGEGVNLRQMAIEMMEEEEPAPSGPILSANEAPLPPVTQPPIVKLPEGERLNLAGDVVSWMRDKKAEAWVAKVAAEDAERRISEVKGSEPVMSAEILPQTADFTAAAQDDTAPLDEEDEVELVTSGVVDEDETAESTAPDLSTPAVEPSAAGDEPKSVDIPKLHSSGTVIVRAMQDLSSTGESGWLEEGSVVCFADGRVVGTVSETLGPLTSPYYQIRLPPPPHPYPTAEALEPGTKLFYPSNPTYRHFVSMAAVRDPRFKGSDASNMHDEEIGEDEMEWSDDEAEAQAKKRRKNNRSGSTAPAAGKKGAGMPQRALHGLPSRPHFDYQGPDETYAGSETGSMYGGEDEGSVYGSEAGSSTSVGRRPVSYDDLEDRGGSTPRSEAGPSRGGGRGGSRGNQRGQGRERGRGRGRGGGRNGNRRDEQGARGPSQGAPQDYSQHAQQYHQTQYQQQPQQQYSHQQQQPYQQNSAHQQQTYQSPFPAPVDSYSPNQPYQPPVNAMQSSQFQQYPQYQMPNPFQQFMPQSPGGPAINPRFAGQQSDNPQPTLPYMNNHWSPHQGQQ